MIIPILIGVGAISTGSWIYHHLLITKLQAQVRELKQK